MDESRPPAVPPPPPAGGSDPSPGDPEGPPPPPVVPPPAPDSPPDSPWGTAQGDGEPAHGAPRRRRWPLVLALLLVLGFVLLVGVGVLVATQSGEDPSAALTEGEQGEADESEEPQESEEPGEPGDDGQPGSGDGEAEAAPAPTDPEAALEPLDLSVLDGVDLEFGRLLTDIDASERVMIAFQEGLADSFTSPESPEAALEGAGEVAAESQAELLEVRERLVEELDDPGAEVVRELYVDHLDAWEEFMAAVADDPMMVFEQGEAGFTVAINATADAFARALEAELPDDVDGEVARFADGILDRGFRGLGYADV